MEAGPGPSTFAPHKSVLLQPKEGEEVVVAADSDEPSASPNTFASGMAAPPQPVDGSARYGNSVVFPQVDPAIVKKMTQQLDRSFAANGKPKGMGPMQAMQALRGEFSTAAPLAKKVDQAMAPVWAGMQKMASGMQLTVDQATKLVRTAPLQGDGACSHV